MKQPSNLRTVIYQDLGIVSYKEAWDYQERLFADIVDRKVRNRDLPEQQQEWTGSYLLLCGHPPVYTLGKSGSMDNLLLNEDGLEAKGIEFFKINRGGDITFHGPDQLVGYPLLNLDYFFTDIHRYLRLLEEVIIRTIGDWGLKGDRYPGYTGVWLEPEGPNARKICAMGVKCSRWVTMHGWALNVNTDLDYFGYIVPCGIDDKAVTSMHTELGRQVDMQEVKAAARHHFAELFEAEMMMAAEGTKLLDSPLELP